MKIRQFLPTQILLYGSLGLVLASVMWLGWLLTTQPVAPQFVNPQNSEDHIIIDRPEVSQAFFGELTGYPHTYLVEGRSGLTLAVELREPAVEEARRIMTGIAVKRLDQGVAEVTRLHRPSHNWDVTKNKLYGVEYLVGPTWQGSLSSDTYLIEVSNPENLGKYILRIGTDPAAAQSYLTQLAAVLQMQRFYERTAVVVFRSPLYYVPILLVIVGAWLWYRRRQTRV